jgi:hypothetical protein
MTTFSELIGRERADARPPPPAGGVPPQRLPGGIRLAIKLCVVPFVWLEQRVRDAVQLLLRPAFRREGRCQRTGACCRFIVARISPLENRLPLVRRLTVWWAEEVNGFFRREVDLQLEEGDDVRVYSCRHLTAEGTCASHWSRPALCRGWPTREWFGEPLVLKGCGYTFVSRDGAEVAKRAEKLPILR